jgi:hypothetical protein
MTNQEKMQLLAGKKAASVYISFHRVNTAVYSHVHLSLGSINICMNPRQFRAAEVWFCNCTYGE